MVSNILTRTDDRMIHGQTVTHLWAKENHVMVLIAVNMMQQHQQGFDQAYKAHQTRKPLYGQRKLLKKITAKVTEIVVTS